AFRERPPRVAFFRCGARVSEPCSGVAEGHALWHSSQVADPDQAPRRPRYLSFVLLVGWLIGLRTLHDGYVTLRVLGDPLVGDTLRLPSSVRQAVVESTLAHSEVTSPLAAAQVVAGVFLLAACAGTLFGLFKRIS